MQNASLKNDFSSGGFRVARTNRRGSTRGSPHITRIASQMLKKGRRGAAAIAQVLVHRGLFPVRKLCTGEDHIGSLMPRTADKILPIFGLIFTATLSLKQRQKLIACSRNRSRLGTSRGDEQNPANRYASPFWARSIILLLPSWARESR